MRGIEPGGLRMQRRSRLARRVAGFVAAVLAGAFVVIAGPTTMGAQLADAQPAGCYYDDSGNLHCPAEVEEPGEDDGSGGDGGGGDEGGDDGSGGGNEPDPCDWQVSPGQAALPDLFPEAPANAVLEYRYAPCNVNIEDRFLEWRWVPGLIPEPVVVPQPWVVAEGVRARVEAMMLVPELAVSPPSGSAAVVHLPTFVEVTNWQGPLDPTGCDDTGIVCVTVTAVPGLTFDPGETGADVVDCDPPGTRYDPSRGDPRNQAAAPGACAHTYTRRTGVASQPGPWEGQVTVTWDVNWTSTVNGAPGPSGSFGEVELSTELLREVDEVQTPVVEADTGGG